MYLCPSIIIGYFLPAAPYIPISGPPVMPDMSWKKCPKGTSKFMYVPIYSQHYSLPQYSKIWKIRLHEYNSKSILFEIFWTLREYYKLHFFADYRSLL